MTTNNLAAWNRNGHTDPDLAAAVRKFEARLRERIPEPTGEQEGLIDYAVTLHGAILLTRRRLFAPNSRAKRNGPFYVQLPVLVGSQLRCLRALGLIGAEPEDEPEGPTFAEWCEQRAREKQQASPDAATVAESAR